MTDTTDATEDDHDTPPADSDTGDDQEGDTFTREYVEKLRSEAAEHRVRAKRADELHRRLLDATVRDATTGILADPTDLPLSDELCDDDGYPDPDRITEAARTLVERKPHLADRRPTTPVDQGARPDVADVDLAGMMRRLAG